MTENNIWKEVSRQSVPNARFRLLKFLWQLISCARIWYNVKYCHSRLNIHLQKWNDVLAAVLQLILFSMMLYVVARLLKKKTMKLHIKELCYLLLILITGILFANIIFNILLIVNENLVFQLYEQFLIFLGIVPVVAALFYAGILITIVPYQKMIGLQEEKYFIEQQPVHAIQGVVSESRWKLSLAKMQFLQAGM